MNILDRVIGVREAAELWGLSPGTVKNLCAAGTVRAKKIGPTWVIDSQQETPARRPRRVKRRRQAEPEHDPNQIDLFDVLKEDDERPAVAPEPPPAAAPAETPQPTPEPALEVEPAPLDPDDLDYFGTMYDQYIEWEQMEETAADDRLRAVLLAYEFAADDQEKILALIKKGERKHGKAGDPEGTE